MIALWQWVEMCNRRPLTCISYCTVPWCSMLPGLSCPLCSLLIVMLVMTMMVTHTFVLEHAQCFKIHDSGSSFFDVPTLSTLGVNALSPVFLLKKSFRFYKFTRCISCFTVFFIERFGIFVRSHGL